MLENEPAITGHVDGLRGAEIAGWAFSKAQSCHITVVDADGAVVGSGQADLARPDLNCLGQGRCDFAFSIPITAWAVSKRLHVLADGVEIANSPLLTGPGLFDGVFKINQGIVEGWVSERVEGAQPPLVTIRDQDGITVFQAKSAAQAAGAEIVAALPRFSGKLDQRCFGAGERVLSAFAGDVKFAEASCNLHLKGHVETLAPDRCSGWLLSTDVPAWPFEIEIYRDGERVGRAKCNIARPDVQASFPGVHKSGFVCAWPAAATTLLATATISFRFPHCDTELFDGPYVVGRRPAIIDAARQASRLAISLPDSIADHQVRMLLQTAMQDFIVKARAAETTVFRKAFPTGHGQTQAPRLSVIIPIYRDVEVTRACIESVLACRSPATDRIVLVNDFSSDSGMAAMLQRFVREPNLFLLNNDANLGFIRSVNRALSFCGSEDVLLLNSDTRVYPGAISRLWEIAHSAADIGTVTALSNNATIFSYPHARLRRDALPDVTWAELAASALLLNGGMTIDVPSGHGFCMLVKRDVLNRLTELDVSFGRGYGEENDLCARAADLGFRNVAAAGVFVEHRESVSFGDEKQGLLTHNLARLDARYPEYTPTIMEVERRDDLRAARWALDQERLRRASAAGGLFALVISHRLGGGTSQAIADIESLVGYGRAVKLELTCRADGYIELESAAPLLHATFAPNEMRPLFDMLAAANPGLVIMHQVLGFPAEFVTRFKPLLHGKQSVFYAHDYYAFCPRVTMVDALGQFCRQAPLEICGRCVALGGAHPAARLGDFAPRQHRHMFGDLLADFTHVVTPSSSAAGYLRAAFPEVGVEVLPHPARRRDPAPKRRSAGDGMVLLGALGPHKGSAKLREIAQLARLTHPDLHFTIIGYTDIDEDLLRLDNVTITGAYDVANLAGIAAGINGRLALFLSTWPETYSYTLSEAMALGFYPLVPDIGAPAERVRSSGYGAVFPFPIEAAQVLRVIQEIGRAGGADLPNPPPSGEEAARDRIVSRTRALFALPGEAIPAPPYPAALPPPRQALPLDEFQKVMAE